jgi:hypothetical protein
MGLELTFGPSVAKLTPWLVVGIVIGLLYKPVVAGTRGTP